MKSTVFHIGVNRTLAKRLHLHPPWLHDDGHIDYVPLPDHDDPDFRYWTYGDPWGRVARLAAGDVAWFIESGTVSTTEWGYFLVAYFVVEAVYVKRRGIWNQLVEVSHYLRVRENAHHKRDDTDYAIVLGDRAKSRLLFQKPLRLSVGENALPWVKEVLGLPKDAPTRGYWFKRWLDDAATNLFREHAKGVSAR